MVLAEFWCVLMSWAVGLTFRILVGSSSMIHQLIPGLLLISAFLHHSCLYFLLVWYHMWLRIIVNVLNATPLFSGIVWSPCIDLESWGPIFEKSYDQLTKNLWKSLTYKKLRMSMWLLQNLTKILWKTYDDITSILRKHKIHGKWCHSGNSLSEAVIGRILWPKNNWQPEWRFPKNAFEKWLTGTIFLSKS